MQESNSINLNKYNKADVLAALYNNSHPQGLGILHFNPAKMTRADAEELLNNQTYFDYLYGRIMKVDLSSNTLEPWDTTEIMVKVLHKLLLTLFKYNRSKHAKNRQHQKKDLHFLPKKILL